MNMESKYLKIVEWSDEDNCFIGSCPELFYGGCHGENERDVFEQLCQIIKETIELYEQDGKCIPQPMSGKDLVNSLQAKVSKNGEGKTLYIKLSAYPCGGADPEKNLTISCPDPTTRFKTTLSEDGLKKFKKSILDFYAKNVLRKV